MRLEKIEALTEDKLLLHAGGNRGGKRFFGKRGVGDLSDKGSHGGCDVLLCHIDHGERFNIDLLAVGLQLNLVSRAELRLGDDLVLDEEVDVFAVEEVRKRLGKGFQII